MNSEFLEGGMIINTHGIRGELKVQPWCDSPQVLCAIKTIFVGETSYKVLSARVHQNNVLMTLKGIENIDDALPLKGKTLLLRRKDVPLAPGRHFIADLIGLDARNADTGEKLGTVKDILNYPAQDLYVVEGDRRYLIPDVPRFVTEINTDAGYISFRILEGMEQ